RFLRPRFQCMPSRPPQAIEQLGLSSSFFFSSRRGHTRLVSDWGSDVCSSDLVAHRRHRLSVDSQAWVAVGDLEAAFRAFHALASLGGSPAGEYASLEWSMFRSVNVKLSLIFARSSKVIGASSSCPSETRSEIRLSIRAPSFSAVMIRTERVAASTPSASDTTALSLNCGLGPS